ncbi:BF3164 family lipoprotein [Parapedobacter koreensis]|uniref:TolB-like 6-blade propeller-like n=1 Tax=Parapedobacter koreensis TaxID=332977 RepID=A0A1H7F154_9SPHI|nr:BF3164 family lipoprotein [Parapedobacter koreensis]SEK19843.1 TolB-like 6-blade propeller-like [Parapedobacter koreensis]
MKRTFSLLLLLVCMVSCQDNQKESFLDSFSNHYNCSPKVLNEYPVDSLGKPEYIYSWRNYIIVSDLIDNYLLSAYDLDSNQFYRFIEKGGGPNELIDIQQLGAMDENRFFVKSTSGSKLHLYGTNRNKDIASTAIKEILSDFVSVTVDGSMIIGSSKGESRFTISDLDNNEYKKEFGENIGSFSQDMASNILQGLCVGSPETKKIAWFSFYGEAAEFYDYSDTTKVHCLKQHTGALPLVNERYVFDKDSKIGITSLTKSDRYIFALYNGSTLEEIMMSKDLGLLSNKILVYNWEGDPIGVLNLDKKVRSISYNIGSDTLYLIGYEEDSYGYNVCYIDNINIILN